MSLDKLAHFWAGAAIAATVALYASPTMGLSAAILAGLVKEIRDLAGQGTPDIRDFIATAAGAVVVLPLIVG